MLEMVEMLLLAVLLEDQDVVQAVTEDLLIPVCPFFYLSTGLGADHQEKEVRQMEVVSMRSIMGKSVLFKCPKREGVRADS